MRKALVTGATGFVGKWLVPRLLEESYEVTCLARSPQKDLFHKSVQWVTADLTTADHSLLIKAVDSHHDVFHLAGLIGYAKRMREDMFRVNVRGTENLVKACLGAGAENLVHMSSVVSIGASPYPDKILNEDSPYNLKPYGFGYFDSKHLAEKSVMELTQNQPLRSLIINPSTIYGPGDAVKGSRSVQVKVAKGKFLFYPQGGVNVVHIQDVVEGIMAALKKGQKNRRYILGNTNMTVKDLFYQIASFANVAPPKICLPKPILLSVGAIGDLLYPLGINTGLSLENARVASLYHWFDNSRARGELGLNFRPSALAIEESVQWILAQSQTD